MNIELYDGTSEEARAISTALLDSFSYALSGKKKCVGGIWRAGTAM